MRVTACLRYDAGLFMGGGELQALDTMRAVAGRGWATQIYEPISRDLGDIVHFFGSMPYYYDLGQLLARDQIPYVVSTIWVSRRSGLHLKTKRLLSQAQGTFPKHIQRLYRGAGRLLTLSALEEDNLRAVFGEDLPPFRRIPIGVDGSFFGADPTLFRNSFGDAPFIFHCGSYSARKGQLKLIEACRGLGLRLVFAGQIHEEDYFDRCKTEATDDTVFLTNLEKKDPLLASAYAAAEVFCLPSESEILSASALEAGVSGCRLVLSNTWGADEYFGKHASYCDPRSSATIRAALETALSKQHDREAESTSFYDRFGWDSVAKSILAEYSAVIAETSARYQKS